MLLKSLFPLSSPATTMSRSALATGRGRSNMPFTALKIAVLAPMPNASVTTATRVMVGFLMSMRTPKRMSWINVCTKLPPKWLVGFSVMIESLYELEFSLKRGRRFHRDSTELFIAQRNHRIDAHRAACRHITCQQRDATQKQ